MFTWHQADTHKMPSPHRTHLPLRHEPPSSPLDNNKPQHSGTIFDNNDPSEDIIHPELERLPSLSLRGTFLDAYGLLVKILKHLGWEDLLKCRGRVFVMEREYRIHQAVVNEEAMFTGSKVSLNEDDKDVTDVVADSLEDITITPRARVAIDDMLSQQPVAEQTSEPSSKHIPVHCN